jgi:DNA repair protein RadC
MNKLSIKDWSKDDQPREKLLDKGPSVLSNSELIAVLIRTGNLDESAVDVSQKILTSANNNLNELGKFTLNELTKFKGIGMAKAISIIAALELGRRRKVDDILNKKKITSSHEVYEYFQPIMGDISHEEFWVLMLNRANKIIERQKISQGGMAGTVIDVKIVFRKALEAKASSIILCHNHPSGNISPSKSDIEITKKLYDAGKTMDISILDHIILTDHDYFSFADKGMIN